MTFEALSSLAIVGVGVSLVVQYLKTRFGGGPKTLAILVGLSVLVGVAGLFVQAHPAFLTMAGTVLATANLAYNFVLQFLENK